MEGAAVPVVLSFCDRTWEGSFSPAIRAAFSALVYLAVAGVYIYASSLWVASHSFSQSVQARFEIMKGLGYVLITGLLFYFLIFLHLRRIQQQEEKIRVQEKALFLAERKVVAATYTSLVAHDLNNLLMALGGLMEGLRGKEGGDELLRNLRRAIENSYPRLAERAKRIAAAARHMEEAMQVRLDLSDSVTRLVEILRGHPDLRSRNLELEKGSSVVLLLNPTLFEEAVLNLLINAGQAAGVGGRVRLRLEDHSEDVLLGVHDSGPGVPEAMLEKIFEAGFTTKPEGTGLGMMAVKAFAESCGGEVSVGRSDLGGACFSIRIPKAEG